jgi:hypothetical protein
VHALSIGILLAALATLVPLGSLQNCNFPYRLETRCIVASGMEACITSDVRQHAVSAVRNLPDAHASWQFSWRNARFRSAIGGIDAALYALDVERLTEAHLELIQDAVSLVIKAIEIHVSSLGSAIRDTVDREYFGRAMNRLRDAALALEQGLSPDPAKRPSDDERIDRFGAGLHRAKLA